MPRSQDPWIPEGIDARDLDGSVRSQLRPLTKENAERVAKHLVVAGQLLDSEPETAYEHAKAAVAHAGRIGAVREVLGIIAYQLEKYDEAIRELRTHRRISGSNDNVALIADSERGRGKPDKALEVFEDADKNSVDDEVWTELVIVAAGAHTDKGDIAKAKELIESAGFTGHQPSETVRLLSAYADLLRIDGDKETGDKYELLARRTAASNDVPFGDEEPDPNADVSIETVEEIDDEPEPPVESDTDPEPAGDEPPSDSSAATSEADADAPDAAQPATESDSSPAGAAPQAEAPAAVTAPGASTAPAADQPDEAAAAEHVVARPANASADAPAAQSAGSKRSLEDEVEDELAELLADAGITEDDNEAPAAGSQNEADAQDGPDSSEETGK